MTPILRRLSIAMLFCVVGSITALGQESSAFVQLGVTEPIKMKETVVASNGTMSGSQRLSIRTNTLFSAFQMISDNEVEKKIRMRDLHSAPIRVPTGAAQDYELRFCAEVRTINGFYEAVGSSTALNKIQSGANAKSFPLRPTSESAEHRQIDGLYTEDLMLLRGFIAPDCALRQSSYFVPLFFDENATKLLAVFEIGNAAVSANLHEVSDDNSVSPEPIASFDCTPTIRVDRGYDCMIDTQNINHSTNGLYEVQLRIVQPHRPEPRIFKARITLPQN